MASSQSNILIAGGGGAAFTNLLFCKSGCKVICFTNYAFNISVFLNYCKVCWGGYVVCK
ncbi:MAG: DUF563 domain-containing protein [Bacteroidetes bacterium]|nr:DUF563 domain-containing protein [Bacteroidota bacterium]